MDGFKVFNKKSTARHNCVTFCFYDDDDKSNCGTSMLKHCVAMLYAYISLAGN